MPKALLTVMARRFKQKRRKNRSIFRSELASKAIKSGASSSHFLLLFFSLLYLLCRAVRKHLAGKQQVLCKPDDLLGSTPLHAEKEIGPCSRSIPPGANGHLWHLKAPVTDYGDAELNFIGKQNQICVSQQ